MKNIAFTLVLLGMSGPPAMASVDNPLSDAENESAKSDQRGDQKNAELARDAAERRTPSWTNDSANINLQQPRRSPDTEETKPYSLGSVDNCS